MTGWISAAIGIGVAIVAISREPPPVNPPVAPQIIVQPTEIAAARVQGRSAIIVGVVAALVAAIAGLVVALVQTTSSNEQARTDFLRQQKQAAYATFLSDQDALTQAEEKYFLPQAVAQANIADVRKQFGDLQQKLVLSAGAVRLIGSQPVAQSAQAITGSHTITQESILNILTLAQASIQYGKNGETLSTFEQDALNRSLTKYSAGTSGYLDQVNRFLSAARVDLNVSDFPNT